jgi:vacuolar-type H+-ATPase subunit E/Vma4
VLISPPTLDSRIEEGRAADQGAEVARQQHIIKLISNELTKNTTRVVEQAVKNEVTNSVLPSLEAITRNEIKNALNGQIAKGLGDSMKVVCLSSFLGNRP